MHQHAHLNRRVRISGPTPALLAALAGLLLGVPAKIACAQAPAPTPPAGTGVVEVIDERLAAMDSRPVRDVVFINLKAAEEALVRNQVRVLVGQPLESETVREDVRRMARLGLFEKIQASVQLLDDGGVVVTYNLTPAPIVQDVQAAGNREIPDADLAAVVGIQAGIPANQFLLDGAKRRIVQLYQQRGFYQVDVTIDTKELAERGIVVFRIREGDPVKVTKIVFEGNAHIESDELEGSTLTREWSLIDLSPGGVSISPKLKLDEPIRVATVREPRQRKGRKGYIDQDDMAADIASLEGLYANKGYLRARVDREIIISPNNREAVVKFVVDEGPRFTVRGIQVVQEDNTPDGSEEPTQIISPLQAATLMPLRAGEALSTDGVTQAGFALRDAYLQMGYVDTSIRAFTRQIDNGTQADVIFIVSESSRAMTGMITVKGNEATQSKVVRRMITVKPDQALNGVALRETERRLVDSGIFDRNAIRVTTQREDSQNPGYRDILVEVAETNTGSFGFGASASSDGGVVGQVSLTQRNFDVFDTPDSFGEFFSGKAFRGAQQTFNLTLAPGNQTQNYVLSLSNPYLFDTDYSGSAAVGYRRRDFDTYNEGRTFLNLGVGRRFGEVWSGSVSARAELVNISSIDNRAATAVIKERGTNTLTGLKAQMSRRSLDRNIRPTRGTVLGFGAEQFGLLGGEFTFTKFNADGAAYIPIDEDALGKRTVLLLRTSAGYIPQSTDDVPFYENFNLGGREFRGFRFQGVGPRGVQTNGQPSADSIGGTFSFFAGAQIEKPVVEETISVVVFVDSGTLLNEVSLDQYRASVGIGLRLYIPQLGPVPLAFDFARAVVREDFDQRRVFSFSLDVPF